MTSDYMVSTDDFDFVVVAESPNLLRGLEGQPVKLTVAGVPQVVGRIDQTSRGDDGSAVTCSGRDYIADLVECNVDPTLVFKEGETLESAILKACAPVGITKVISAEDMNIAIDLRLGVQGRVKKSKDNKSKGPKDISLQDLKPDLGQGIYEFLKPICDHHHCTIQPTLQRDTLAVAGPHYNEKKPIYAISRNRSQSTTNNVMSATVTRDYSSTPTMVIVQGQGAPRTGEPTGSATQIIDTSAQAKAFGGELREILEDVCWSGRRKPGETVALPIKQFYRLNVFRDDRAKTHEEIKHIAKRLFCEHLKKSLEYRVKLRGHIDPYTGQVWTVNTIVRVADEICDVNEDLWIQSRRLSFSSMTGAVTELVCIRPDTFDFQPEIVAPKQSGSTQTRKQAPDRFYNPQNYSNPFSLSGETPPTAEQEANSPERNGTGRREGEDGSGRRGG